MSKTKKFLSFIFIALLTIVLVGCNLPTPGGNDSQLNRTKSEAEAALTTVADRTLFTTEELEPTANKITLTKNYAGLKGVTFDWSSSNEQVINITEDTEKDTYVGNITRPVKETEDEPESVQVTITCTIMVSYTKLDDGTSKTGTVSTTKSFTFTIKKVAKTNIETIEEAKTKEKGTVVTVEGIVISIMYHDSYDKATGANEIRGLFIKDSTAGIYVYCAGNYKDGDAKVGDKVKVSGEIGFNYEAIQICGSTTNPLNIEVVETNQPAPSYTSETKSLSEAISGDYQSYASNFHKVYAKVEKSIGTNTNINLVDPYTGEAVQVYYRTSLAGITGIEIKNNLLETMESLVGKYVNIPIVIYYANNTDTVTPIRVQLAMGSIEMADAPTLTDADMIAQTITKLSQLEGTYEPGDELALITSDATTGTTITWDADVNDVIDLTSGKISETAANQTVKLTATVKKGTATDTVDIEIVIKKTVLNPAPAAGTYVYEVVTTESTLYALAEMDGNYLKTTTDKAAAATVVLTEVNGGYTITLGGKYLRVVRNESNGKTYNNINLDGTASDVWTWNGEAGVMTYNISGTEYYIGTYKGSNGTIFSTFSASAISYITGNNAANVGVTNFITKFVSSSDTPTCEHSWDDGIVTKKPTCEADGVKTFTCDKCQTTKDEKVDKLNHNYNAEGICENCGESKPAAHPAPEAGNYVLKMEQKGLGKTLYALDQMDGYYVASTDDINLAATVVLTKVEGGYIIKVGNKYLEFQISGTYKNIKLLEQSTGAVWTWNETYGIMTFDLEGEPYFVGTYSTNKTFSATGLFRITGDNEGALGTTQYAAYLVKTDDTPVCDHSWDAGVVTIKPTCETAGVKTFTCSSCNDTKTEVIDALEHTEPNAEGKCDSCGKVLVTTKPAPVAGNYVYVINSATLNKKLYVTATLNEASRLVTTEKASEASVLVLAVVEGGYTITLNGKYLEVTGTKIVLLDTPTSLVWTWNADLGVMTTLYNGTTYYLGTYDNNNVIFSARISSLTRDPSKIGVTEFVCEFETVSQDGADENDTIKFDFVNGADISDWSSWASGYAEHEIVIDDVNITISKGNKQGSGQTIDDRPVMVAGKTDGLDQYLTVDMGDTAITSVVFELKQWNTKTFDSITVEYWDGEAWVEAGKLETLSGECSVSATFSETTKVRLHITAPATQNRVQLGLTSVTVTKA